MSDLDKDIEIVKEIIKCDGCRFATCEQCEINWTQVNAISNVLSELERYKELYFKALAVGVNEVKNNHYKNNQDLELLNEGWKIREKELLEELETYKKIAEKLADILSHKILETLGIKPRIEDLIESARKEVENVQKE